jgi:putative endonuclease
MRPMYVYILANQAGGTLYIGVTNDLVQRVHEHKSKETPGFTQKYNLTNLVYYEVCDSPEQAIAREKQLKAWRRAWKLKLIHTLNPTGQDLYPTIL